MDKDDLVKRMRDRAAFCPIGERNLDEEAADALSRSRDEALEEAAKVADKYGVYWNASKIAEKIRALKIAAPQGVDVVETTASRVAPAESATVVVPREPTREILKVILGDPIIIAASDEQNAREWYARFLAAAQGEGK